MDNQQFGQAIEPLVAEVEALRLELAALKATEPPTVEPLVACIEELRREVEGLRARLDAPTWTAGVHRKGVVVQHFHGQYFEAEADTAIEPGDGLAWKRLGTAGFRYRGLYVEGAEYDDGDLIARDGGTMFVTGGRLHWMTIRGQPGPRGRAAREEAGR